MKKLSKFFLNNKYILIFFVLICLYGVVSFALDKKDESSLLKTKKNKIVSNRQVVYTKQYNDREITLNAKKSDERFRNISYFNKQSLLSNVISSFIKSGEVIKSVSAEKGTWLWTPTKYLTPEYAEEIVAGAKKNNLNVIYLSIDSYLDIYVMPSGLEKDKALEDFNSKIKYFIKLANQNGIEVDAEAGWQNWAQEGHIYKPGAILEYVIGFNKENKEKFRGFQYDVEVYLLPEYKDNKIAILKNFLNLVDQSVTKIARTDLQFSVVVPEFYDDSSRETVVFRYNGKNSFPLEHLLDILEKREGSKVIVMSYRNKSLGDDGSIKISEDEIYLANEYSTKIIIAQETGNFLPPEITFYGTSRKYYETQVLQIKQAFENEKSFGGMATHYANSFFELE